MQPHEARQHGIHRVGGNVLSLAGWLCRALLTRQHLGLLFLIIKPMTPRNTEDGDASGAGGLIGTKLYTAAGTYETVSHRHCEILRTRAGVLRGATASRYGVRGTAPVYSARVLLSWQQAALRMLTTVRNSGGIVGQART